MLLLVGRLCLRLRVRGLALGVLLGGGLLGGVWSRGLLMRRLGWLLGIWRLRGLQLGWLRLWLLLI